MLAKGKKTSNPDEKSGESSRKCGMRNWYENNQRSIIAVALIAIVAFVLRFIFAFGTSVDNGTALSGGTSASEHLHALVALLDGGSFVGADGTLNYPFGSTNPNPVLYDLILSPFALLGKAMGMTSVQAASAALAWGAIIFGVLATIMAYFVGKEFLGEKKHGYLAAAFIAFCPVVITNTVFSNGSEIAFVSFLFMVMSYFIIKGMKSLDTYSMPTDKFADIFRLNKKAMIYAVISGIIFAVIVLSWNGFRSVANALCVVLAIMVLVDRFRKKDSRVIAIYFSIILLIAMVAATAYYVPSGLWEAVLSGVLISSLLSVAVCLSFASLQKIPWTITIPVYAIVLIAVFVALYFLAPDYFNAVMFGNSVYAESYGSLVSVAGLSVSQLATYYGFITLWFPFIMVFMMLWKLPRNINSPAYIFSIIWMCFGIGYGIVSEKLAVVYAPIYALGFAYILAWLFDNVKFKEYFDAIRASDLKSVWRKLLKPIPFLSIVGVLLLICAPNALYAIDASIPSNDMDDKEGLQVGALNYYIRTDSDWKVNDVLSQYSQVDKTGAMLTWSEYSSDASTYGGFSVTTDTVGNGARSTSLTLLASATDNKAVADMAINLIIYNGIDASKDALISAGMTEAVYDEIKKVMDNPGESRSKVINDPEKYGIFKSSISDESLIYAVCSEIFTDNYSAFQIAEFYEAMVNVTGKNIDYVMVTGDMIPISYGGNSLFTAMASVADYQFYDDYGTVSEFEKTDSTSMYTTMYSTGVYLYTESMTDSLLWRSYIGVSPEEAGFTSSGFPNTSVVDYFTALMLSDGSTKATPGFGLANFKVDESSWYVKYNPDSDATVDADGWVKMLAKDAQALQEKDGGLINYLAGYPVIMKYVSNESGTPVSGTVTNASGTSAVKGIRVTVLDKNGMVGSSVMTDKDGKYTVLAHEGDTIEFVSASSNMIDGTLVKSVEYTDPTVTSINASVPATSIDFKLVDSDGDDLTIDFIAKAKFVGQNTGVTETVPIASSLSPVYGVALVPDIYDITVTDELEKNTYATATYTVVPGDNTMYKIKITMYTVTITVTDDMGVTDGSEYVDTVTMTDTTYGNVFTGNNVKGTVVVDVIEGTYGYTIYKGSDALFTETAVATISTDTTVTLKYCKSNTPSFATSIDGQIAVIYSMGGYQGSTVEASTAKIPAGTAGNAVFTIYSVKDSNVYLSKSDTTANYIGPGVKVSGTLKNSSGTGVAGTVVFIKNGMQIPVSSGSDGKYSVVLPSESTFTVYAQYGSEVLIEKDFTTASAEIADKDLTTANGTKVTGSVYWSYSSSNTMVYVPVTVSYDGIDFNLVTDSKGTYTMYIPADKTCNITANVGGTSFYFDTAGTATNVKENSTGGDFSSVKVKDATVKNSTGYKVTLDGKEIEVTDTSVSVTSKTWSAYVYDSDGNILINTTIPVSVTDLTHGYFDIPDYVKVTLNGVTNDNNVTVTQIENKDGDKGAYQALSTSSKDKYFFEKGTSSDPYEYLITIKDKSSDYTKIAYAYLVLDGTEGTVLPDLNITLEKYFTLSGYVGLSGSSYTSTVTALGTAVAKDNTLTGYKVDAGSDGTYKMILPCKSSGTYDFEADVKKTVGNDVYNYSASRSIPLGEFEAEKVYVRNFAVTDLSTEYKGDVKAALDIPAGGMQGSTIKFMVKITESKDTSTYILSAGAAWQDLTFYSDSLYQNQISSVKVSSTVSAGSPAVVYAVGKISINTAGFGSDDLSVNIADINGEASCVAVFEDATNWVKTTNNKSVIEYGSDAVGKSEYKYAVSITNYDNYVKSFTISDVASTEGTLTDKWFVTFVDGDSISASGVDLEVAGYETATFYVKITVKDALAEKVPEITFKVTSNNTGETFVVGDNVEGGITMSGNVATVKSVEQNTLLGITSMSADGRGVYNEYGSTPAYVWVLFGIVIVLTILVLWLGMKRGAFSRKK